MSGHVGHVVPVRVYVVIFVTLMVLTALTIAAARVDLGALNTIAALMIAVTKASLVVLYFMHVRYSPRLTWIVVGAGVFFLVVMLSLTASDTLTRTWLGFPPG